MNRRVVNGTREREFTKEPGAGAEPILLGCFIQRGSSCNSGPVCSDRNLRLDGGCRVVTTWSRDRS